MLDLDDEKILNLSNVLSNKTCKKILEYLADKEASEAEISRDLNLPANTVNYNIRQLLNSGFIEKSKDFFWSVKGKRVLKYRIAKKSIIISPRSSNFKSVLAAVLITAIGALIVKVYNDSIAATQKVIEKTGDSSAGALSALNSQSSIINSPISSQFTSNWEWFLLGGLFALVAYFLISRLRWFR